MRAFPYHPLAIRRTTKDNDQGMAGSNKRILEGMSLLSKAMRVSSIVLTIAQSQNNEPITGISSEGYSGKGHVQSKPAKPGQLEE